MKAKIVFGLIVIINLLICGSVFALDPVNDWLEADIRIDTDEPGSAASWYQQISSSNGFVGIAWYDNRNGEYDIYFNYSEDGGSTWQSNDIRLDTDIAGSAHSTDPQISSSGGSVFVVWEDNRSGYKDIYLNYSEDGGSTWQSSDIRLDTDIAGSATSFSPQISSSDGSVFVVWEDSRNGFNNDIYFNYSEDGGSTWQSNDIRLDTDIAGSAYSIDPQISSSGGSVFVVWRDDRNGEYDIYFNYSEDGGSTWQSSDIRLDTDIAGSATSFSPQISSSNGFVGIVWYDTRNGYNDIYFNYSEDGGSTWQSNDIRLDTDIAGSAYSTDPQISSSDGSVFVVWEDNRSGYKDIYLNYSEDGGSTWQSNDIRLDTDIAGSAYSIDPQISSSGGSVFVVWRDDRNDKTDIYLNYSGDGGNTWLDSDIRLDTDQEGEAFSYNPQINSSDGSVFVVWRDNRNGKEDIYFNTLCCSPVIEQFSLDNNGNTEYTNSLTINTDFHTDKAP